MGGGVGADRDAAGVGLGRGEVGADAVGRTAVTVGGEGCVGR